jgi:hypothetical protein
MAEALALVRPGHQYIFRASSYVLAFVFYGPLAAAVLLPFGLPPKHPLYYIFYVIGVVPSLVWVHWSIKQMLNGCYFTLTNVALELGNDPKTIIRINDVTDVIPIAYHRRLFRRPQIKASPTRFNLLLLRLRNGSRLSLVAVSNVQGFEKFLAKLIEVLKPVWREAAVFSTDDMNAMRPRCANKVQLGAVLARSVP